MFADEIEINSGWKFSGFYFIILAAKLAKITLKNSSCRVVEYSENPKIG